MILIAMAIWLLLLGGVSPAQSAVDSLAVGEIRELRGLEWGCIKDGGSLMFDAVCASGDTLRLFVDNGYATSMRDRGANLPGLIHLGGTPLVRGSQAERELIAELRSWIDRNFVRGVEGTIVDVSEDATDPSPTIGEARTLEHGLRER